MKSVNEQFYRNQTKVTGVGTAIQTDTHTDICIP